MFFLFVCRCSLQFIYKGFLWNLNPDKTKTNASFAFYEVTRYKFSAKDEKEKGDTQTDTQAGRQTNRTSRQTSKQTRRLADRQIKTSGSVSFTETMK